MSLRLSVNLVRTAGKNVLLKLRAELITLHLSCKWMKSASMDMSVAKIVEHIFVGTHFGIDVGTEFGTNIGT